MARPTPLGLFAVLMCAVSLLSLPPQRAQAALDPYTVTTTRDLLGAQCGADSTYPNECSLRQAITKARTDAPVTGAGITVKFAIPFVEASGPNQGQTMPGYDNATRTWTITLTNGPLPIINKVVNINGATQATTAGFDNLGPLVFVDGRNVTTRGGFTFQAVDGASISRIGVINFLGASSSGDLAGVGIELLNSSNIKIIGCSVGVNQAGTAAAPNDAAGVLITGGGSNTIGGNNSLNSEFNVISGNATDGILIRDSDNNKIIGNRIGTDRNGSTAIPNGDDGIELSLGSVRNQIGTPPAQPANDATLRNTIAGNGGLGVLINESSANQVNGNWIGNNYAQNVALPNGAGGVQIFSSVSEPALGNVIGGENADARNIISGNNGPGVAIIGPLSTQNTVRNNYIGVGLFVSSAFGNTVGIEFTGGGNNNVIGSPIIAEQGNVISGNKSDAIRISGTNNKTAVGTVVKANVIGLFPVSGASKPNTGAGIVVGGYAESTSIGGPGSVDKNVISTNTGAGVIVSTNSLTTTVAGNLISANGSDGVQINGATGTVIGGSTLAAGNTITGNTANGIHITSTGTTTTTLRYNTIGGTASGAPNTQNGILVDAASGPVAIRNGTIYGNKQNGVLVSGSSQRVSVLDTSFTANGQKGIALAPATTTSPGTSTNANHDINPPFNLHVNQAKQVFGRVLVDKTGNIPNPASCITCTIQLFGSDPTTLDGEGRDLLQTSNLKIDNSGYFTATVSTLPKQLLATATDYQGNTSEFATLDVRPSIDISPDGQTKLAAPSEVISYTFKVTNNGTVDFDNLDLKLDAKSDKRWTVDIQPKTLSLKANPGGVGESKPVTLTLTLPEGVDPRVRIPTVDTTYITVSSTLPPEAKDSTNVKTTVASKFILRVTPTAANGSGVTVNPPPAKPFVVPYSHKLENIGNLSGTVTVTASTTTIDGNFAVWQTELTTTTLTLDPGAPKDVVVRVSVPYEADAGTQAKTTITVSSPSLAKPVIFTDTTTVARDLRATIGFDSEADGKAGQVTTIIHEVQNIGNSDGTFKLSGASSLGSRTTFRSLTPGIVINSNGTFTLNTTDKRVLRFAADITVASQALRGNTDTVTITLSDDTGLILGGVQDKINVTQSAIIPRLWLPLIVNPAVS